MSLNRSTGFTPFFMVYGTRPCSRTTSTTALQDALDQLEEARDVGLIRSTKYQQTLRRYDSRNVRGWAFKVGDLVLQHVQLMKDKHKLSPPWEGPFIIAQVLGSGAYKLKNEKAEVYTNVWNIEQLRRFSP